MQEAQFRNRMTWMMFVLSILVIWVHSYNVELFAAGQWGPAWERAAKIEKFLSVGIGQVAVPGFFLCSSWLYFRSFSLKKLIGKWKSRCISILIPYIVWNFLYYIGYVTATRLPAVQTVVGKAPIPLNLQELTNAILHYSYAPVFWYMYQLIFLILLSPVIYMLVKNRFVGLAYLGVLIGAVHVQWSTGHPNTDALFYYSLAAYGTVHGRWLEGSGTLRRSSDKKVRPEADSANGCGEAVRGGGRSLKYEWMKRLAAAAVMLAAGAVCYRMMGRTGVSAVWTVAYRTFIPIGFWLIVSGIKLPESRPWMRLSLFLYAIHFMIVRFINKGAALVLTALLPEFWCGAAAVVIYLLMPVMTVAISYGVARILERFAPPLWYILAGGRKL